MVHAACDGAGTAERRRPCPPLLLLALPALLAHFPHASAQSASPGLALAFPVQAAPYDFHDSQAAGVSPAQRLRDAPLPDPSTLPKPDTSLHDPDTGADTTAFGTAYTYANPLNDTTSGDGTVAQSASKSAGVPVRQGLALVVIEWGYPPVPLPKVPGDDLTAAPPPIPKIQFAVQADDGETLDARSLWIVGRAVQAYGRTGLTEITIERPLDRPHCCTQYARLVRDELIREGLSANPSRWLAGHRIRLVLAAMPASR